MSVVPTSLPTLAARLSEVARKGLNLSHVLVTVSSHIDVEGTKALAHCHHVALDGSSLPRLADFTDAIADWLFEYVIPRTKLMESSSLNDVERRQKEQRLRREAVNVFKRHGMSGEHGEMLLFVLAEAFLGLPQLLCKMDLKTDPEMHFHGLDGVHCGPGETEDRLAIYWCESKVHKSLGDALSEALDGLKPFLVSAGTGGVDKRRELALLDRYMDIGDPQLQHAILKSIDPHSSAFNSVSWRGLCLVGFDYAYPDKPNAVKHADFKAQVEGEFARWKKMIKTRAINRNLENFEIHFFYIPLGFCHDFRTAMATSLGL